MAPYDRECQPDSGCASVFKPGSRGRVRLRVRETIDFTPSPSFLHPHLIPPAGGQVSGGTEPATDKHGCRWFRPWSFRAELFVSIPSQPCRNVRMSKSAGIRLGVYLLLLFIGAAVVYAIAFHRVHRDAAMRRKIVGNWAVQVRHPSGPLTVGAITVTADGSYTSRLRIISDQDTKELVMGGTWLIRDGVMISSVTNTSNPGLGPLGSEARTRIIRLHGDELVIESAAEHIPISLLREKRKTERNQAL
jgi:hypothetical protein